MRGDPVVIENDAAPWSVLGLLAVLGLLLAAPVVLAPWPIAQDLPAHVESAWQILGVWRGDAVARSLYVVHAPPWPNALPTMAIASLLSLIPQQSGLLAGKVVTAVGVMLWPVSLGLLYARLKRPAVLAALAIPTAFDLSFSYGFVHFVVGKPLWVLTLVAAIDVARRPAGPGSWWRLMRLALAIAALFSTHLMLFATAAPLCGLLILLLGAGLKTRALGLLAVFVGGLPSLWWASQHLVHDGGATAFLPLTEMLTRLWTNLGDLAPGPVDAAPWWVCGLTLVFLLVVGARLDRFFTAESVAAAMLFVCVAGFALFGPVRTPQVSIVAERFTAVAAALLIAVVPVTLTARRTRLVVLAGCVAAGLAGGASGLRFVDFSRDEMSNFSTIVDAVPPGANVATLYGHPGSPHGRHNALWHWPKLLAAKGARTDDTFAQRATCVVTLAPGATPLVHPRLNLREPPTQAGHESVTVQRLQAGRFTHLLTARIDGDAARRLEQLGLRSIAGDGVGHGVWRLYAVPSPPAP